jgi:hypothetical protein
VRTPTKLILTGPVVVQLLHQQLNILLLQAAVAVLREHMATVEAAVVVLADTEQAQVLQPQVRHVR